jgi:ABC-type antimicrobial peptide transport system permease subunit
VVPVSDAAKMELALASNVPVEWVAAPRLLKSFLYGVSASDPITFTFIAFTLLTIAFLACWIPARRASRLDQ